MSLPQPMRRWRRRGFYVLVRSLVRALRRLPAPVGRAALRGLARMAWSLRGPERRMARSNLRRALPSLPDAEVDRLARASLLRLADNLLDMVRQDVVVRFEDADRRCLQELLDTGPVLVLMAHAGAWELAGPALVQCTGERFAAVVAAPHNRRIGAWLRAEREARRIRCFDRDREVAAAARWLARGGCLAVLADHRPHGPRIEAPWFGHPAPTSTGPARLARVAGARILPLGVRREGTTHRIGLAEPFEATGELADDAARCNEALQELILRSPEEWTWFHDRYDEAQSR